MRHYALPCPRAWRDGVAVPFPEHASLHRALRLSARRAILRAPCSAALYQAPPYSLAKRGKGRGVVEKPIGLRGESEENSATEVLGRGLASERWISNCDIRGRPWTS